MHRQSDGGYRGLLAKLVFTRSPARAEWNGICGMELEELGDAYLEVVTYDPATENVARDGHADSVAVLTAANVQVRGPVSLIGGSDRTLFLAGSDRFSGSGLATSRSERYSEWQ